MGNRKLWLLFLGIFLMSIAWTSCYYDKEALIYPAAGPCDTSAVKYSVQVSSILNDKCYACHSTTAASANGGGVILDTYPSVKRRVDDGSLLRVIQSNDPSTLMPKGGPKMSECNIATIRTWVRNGAPEN